MIVPPRVPADPYKPRLRRRHGIWACVTPHPERVLICGCGYTPKGAFREWEHIQRGEPWEPETIDPALAEVE